MLCAMQRTARARNSCPEPDWLQKFKFVSTDRNVPGVVTALSTEGAVTLPEASCFNSAQLVASAGECPLHARAVVILFNPEAHNAAGAQPKYLLQFTKRRMRTFITIPSARNINSTDDPP